MLDIIPHRQLLSILKSIKFLIVMVFKINRTQLVYCLQETFTYNDIQSKHKQNKKYL